MQDGQTQHQGTFSIINLGQPLAVCDLFDSQVSESAQCVGLCPGLCQNQGTCSVTWIQVAAPGGRSSSCVTFELAGSCVDEHSRVCKSVPFLTSDWANFLSFENQRQHQKASHHGIAYLFCFPASFFQRSKRL